VDQPDVVLPPIPWKQAVALRDVLIDELVNLGQYAKDECESIRSREGGEHWTLWMIEDDVAGHIEQVAHVARFLSTLGYAIDVPMARRVGGTSLPSP
jgi:hypothetical protein